MQTNQSSTATASYQAFMANSVARCSTCKKYSSYSVDQTASVATLIESTCYCDRTSDETDELHQQAINFYLEVGERKDRDSLVEIVAGIIDGDRPQRIVAVHTGSDFMNWFDGMTADQIRNKYTELAREYHPTLVAQRGGTENDCEQASFILGEINEAYQQAMATATVAAKPQTTDKQLEQVAETEQDIMEVLVKLVAIPGLDIEVCGTWIWISGETKPVKEEIKAVAPGYINWSPKKMMWYWKPYTGRGRGNGWSMDKIRFAHGSQRVTKDMLEDRS